MRRHVDPTGKTALADEFNDVWEAIRRLRQGVSGIVNNDDLGLSSYVNINTTNVGSVVKPSDGAVFSITMTNDDAAQRFVKLYDKATAPTFADTPVQVFALPTTVGPVQVLFPNGLDFSLGIGVRATTGVADADNGAPGANQVIVNIGYR